MVSVPLLAIMPVGNSSFEVNYTQLEQSMRIAS